MEDIGCHFKFEKIFGNCYHNTNLLLSSGRNCLRYIIREKKIKTLFLPYFLCESLRDVSLLENVNIIYYYLDKEMLPIIDESQLNESTYLYFVNYYGLLRQKINDIVEKYKYVVIDNTHDFFDSNSYNADVIYNYRKYFGVPDGSCIVSSDLLYSEKYPIGVSLDKIVEMVSRDETGKYFHYETFVDADKYFKNEELCYISSFTENYLHSIDYYKALKKRLENYRYLSERLTDKNGINTSTIELTYMYPLLVDAGDSLRNYLQGKKIHSQMLWPNVEWNGSSENEKQIARKIVLLPIDQRYSEKEMEYIANTVDDFCKIKALRK